MTSFDTEKNPHVWLDLEDVKNLTRKQIEDKMILEAREAGFEPIINEYTDRPEILLRSKYDADDKGNLGDWICDGYVMFIEKVTP